MPQQVVPVAPAFFESLLFSTHAREAVCTLSQFWSVRASTTLPRFGLSEAEYCIQLALIFTGEVGNGGHTQFFLNRPGRAAETRDALGSVGLEQLATLLGEACRVFPGGVDPRDEHEMEVALDKLTPSQEATLSRLDREAFQSLPAVDAALLSHARDHRHEILLPEVPLDRRVGRSRVDP